MILGIGKDVEASYGSIADVGVGGKGAFEPNAEVRLRQGNSTARSTCKAESVVLSLSDVVFVSLEGSGLVA